MIGERSNSVFVTSAKGQVVKAITLEAKDDDAKAGRSNEIATLCVGGQGVFVHAITSDGVLHSLNIETGRSEHSIKVHDKEIVGVAVHPHLNLVATYAMDGELRLWRAQ